MYGPHRFGIAFGSFPRTCVLMYLFAYKPETLRAENRVDKGWVLATSVCRARLGVEEPQPLYGGLPHPARDVP